MPTFKNSEQALARHTVSEASGEVELTLRAPRSRGRRPDGGASVGKDALVDFVSRDLDTTKQDSRLIVESVTRAITEHILRYHSVHVPGLGSFRVLETPAREGRNPRTGVTVEIDPGRRLTFRAARPLKHHLSRRRR